jgi:DNA-binding NarL/FixJ family response regulator
VRELQTLALVAEGKPYGVIADHLHVSYKTVANTCTQRKAKLGVRTLPHAHRHPASSLRRAGEGDQGMVLSVAPGRRRKF